MFRVLSHERNANRVTYFVCGKCDEEDYFYRTAAPLCCSRCKAMIPSPLDLAYCSTERIAYHLDKDKEIFD